MSNLKLRVIAPEHGDTHDDIGESDDDIHEGEKVVYGDGTATFNSSTYQTYAFTFESMQPLSRALNLRHTFRFEQDLLDALQESGLLKLDQSKKDQGELSQSQIDDIMVDKAAGDIERKFKRQAASKMNELRFTEQSYPVGEIDDADWRIADFQFWLQGNPLFGRYYDDTDIDL